MTVGPDTLLHVLLALTAVIVCGYGLGRLFRHVGQPPVIGEVVAGILLGPSLLGRVAPEAYQFVLPSSVAPFLGIIAQFGVILYMFVLGLEFDIGSLRQRAKQTLAISASSIVVPFLLGLMLALFLHPRLSSDDVPLTTFAMFIGISLAVTAFPVLARILTDRGIHKTEIGMMALSCAAINDVAAWCMLALVVGIAQAKVGGALMVLAWTAAFVGVMFLVVKPLANRIAARSDNGDSSRGMVTLVFVALLLSSLTAEFIGIHAIFGAFLLGVVIPHDSMIARTFAHKLEDLVTVVFLPAFFAFTGMRTEIGIIAGIEDWLICGLVIVAASVGKVGGTLAAARLTGMSWRDAGALAVLMNTRGLMELIVLNIGLDLKIISPRLFAILVIMAIVTTMLTGPVLHLFHRPSRSSDCSQKRQFQELATDETPIKHGHET